MNLHHPEIRIYQKNFNDNVAWFARQAKQQAIFIVAKANAYGIGLAEIAHLCQENDQVHGVCVIDLQEALLVRSIGFAKQIIILGYVHDYTQAALHNLECLVYDVHILPAMIAGARKANRSLPVHLHIDTKFGRLGLHTSQVADTLHTILQTPHLTLVGSMSHFSHSTNPQQSRMQHNLFLTITKTLHIPGIQHMCSSHSTILQPYAHHDLIRLGIGAYGFLPDLPETQQSLHPIFDLHAPIIQKKIIPKGQPLGYGGKYTPIKDTLIAIISCGYADGLDRMWTNGLYGRAGNTSVPAIGAISMNLTVFDISEVPEPDSITAIQLFIPNHSDQGSLTSLASHTQTDAYELMTKLSPHIPRHIIPDSS